MSVTLVLVLGLGVLAFVSGMLGLGVAFAALPWLGLFLPDLVHQVQPLSLLLNGLTGIASTLGFAKSGLVEWRRGAWLAAVTTAVAPLGSWLAQRTDPGALWLLYFGAAIFLAYRLFRPVQERPAGEERYPLALALAVPIGVLSGLLGVGPGFLLLPTLILCGFEAKHAAGMNALAITAPSFSALVPHLATARLDLHLALTLVVVGVIAAYVGARVTSTRIKSARLKQMFAVLIVLMTAYKLLTLLVTLGSS